MEKAVLYLWINLINGVGNIRINRLISELKGIENVYNAKLDELVSVSGIGKTIGKRIFLNKSLENAKNIKYYCDKNKIRILYREDKEYFKELLNYEDAPSLLYIYGIIKKYKSTIGVVGGRDADMYGKKIALKIGEETSENGGAIISGMSEGIEAYVQSGVIRKKGYSICILGTGIDGCYPKVNERLKKALEENCLLVSEFRIGTPPIRENFIKRNKLIAMLSSKIVVIQGRKNSGSLIVAKYGIKDNKEVFAVPGNIDNDLNEGCNILLRNGAKPYLGIGNIIRRKKKEEKKIEEGEQKLLRIIKEKERSIDELLLILGMKREILINNLFNLELKGEISCLNGRYY